MKKEKAESFRVGELTPEDIAEYLEKVRFRKKLFGGADEYDVWRKIRRIDEMYAKKLEDQRVKYEALIDEREKMLRKTMQRVKSNEENEKNDGKA